MKDLSVIIISYNTKDLLINCLVSVFANAKDIDIEVIVVDNASNDGSVEIIEQKFPIVKIIANNENLGFAKANNIGIKASSGKYILLLNSDTIVLNNALSLMVKWMEENKEAGVSTCKLLNEDNSIQPTGGFFPTLPRLFAWQFFIDDVIPIKSYHPKTSFYDKERELDWVTGAFFLMKKEVIQEVGYFDEKFFMYAEELEYCYRIKKAGFKIVFTPLSSIIHLGFKSGSKEKALVGEYESLKYFYQKHYSPTASKIARLILKLGALLRSGIISKTTYEKCFKVV